MSLDINRKKVTKNAYRVTKVRDKTTLRVRVPGGEISGELLLKVSEIANNYGNGKVHLTTRQGFEIMGIDWDKIDEVNLVVESLMEGLGINHNDKNKGYPAAGTRNIAACIGNKICPKAQYNTTELAKKIEKKVFPHDFHFKIALTGCPNDCQKIRMHDFGIIGMTLPKLEPHRCISCGRCEKKCKSLSTGAIKMNNYKPVREHDRCIGCGECVLNCPVSAWTRDSKKYYRLAIMGRTGKRNPRLAEDWMIWADEESIIKIIKNTYDYVNEYIDRTLPKEHIGYIVDRTGFMEFKKWALKEVKLPSETVTKDNIYWSGVKYPGIK
ncbi:sulfite reductase subunit C [Ilyobacter polytropus]|uniref:Sulfite reductase, subunit C n=1 Tax=Ilyobacter polytropus (strain ATCC 51220 / DSM 2926 / LMG 16218 / CuHBu1) TaxID=572544 RepID=E3HCK3_ILYPC|nr:sulfite reductase subunit C [Ilyobacter polytropus]ADO83979.1 sulfite reductase, subunit C [Ilyobacter polytropus DSM 2926]